VTDPNEVSAGPERSGVSGQEKQLSGKFDSSTRDADSYILSAAGVHLPEGRHPIIPVVYAAYPEAFP
jgi:hypothetical protein